ncbi:DUF5996 family protein [Echinicola jeungdonensis]|uniref:DUF5996 family protein n=1 Tax=Echinicola jeungdonensis TaxID=709343 RepID=A0ABV5J290_9BACT|nr:DUF5996 family protein [Echinicola jeungdonensis]MDN3668268.1 DUF5996 family protein [Echinicola jeungdonensis]
MKSESWPELSFEKAKETYETIHMWTQIVGKIKLVRLPWINHSWHITFFVTPFGLTTGDIPYPEKHFQINFDFLNHYLQIITSKNEEQRIDLKNLSVASCFKKTFSILKDLDIECEINPLPNELENPVPFHLDEGHSTYNPQYATDLHQVLLNAHEIFIQFRSEFIGKCSPVHFFWGGFDLAVTRFSGREAPLHPGGIPHLPDRVTQEAYSQEVSSCGFWPGNGFFPQAAFYNYMYPEPEGLKNATIKPDSAFYHQDLGEFILPYKELQESNNPSQMVTDFLHSTYKAGANLAKWDRQKLEKVYSLH